MADTGNYTTQILSFDHDLLSEVEWMSAENARLRAQRPQPSDMREGVRPDADGFQGHLIWWPDELPVPHFEGAPGSRKLVVGPRDPSIRPVSGTGVVAADDQNAISMSILAIMSDLLHCPQYVIAALIGKEDVLSANEQSGNQLVRSQCPDGAVPSCEDTEDVIRCYMPAATQGADFCRENTSLCGLSNVVLIWDDPAPMKGTLPVCDGPSLAPRESPFSEPEVASESVPVALTKNGKIDRKAYVREFERSFISALTWKPVAADDPAPMKGSVPGQDDAVTKRINDVIDDLTARQVVGESRKDLRKALDAADKPETGPLPGGVHRAPEGLGRALGSTRYPFGIGGRSS